MKLKKKLTELFQLKKIQLAYIIVLITLIPSVIAFNTIIVLKDFQETMNIELQRKAFLSTKIVDLLGNFNLQKPQNIQKKILEISNIAQEFYAIDILIPDKDEFKVLASLEPKAIGKKTIQTPFIISWQKETAIAYKTNSAKKTNAEDILSITPKISPHNFWVITKPIFNNGRKQALLSIKISSQITENLINRILKKSYILLILTVLLVIMVVLAIIQIFKSMLKFRKKVEKLDELKTKFIEVVSHQLRTPLNSIKWNLELLLNEDLGKLTPEMKNFINATYQSNQNIINIVQELILSLDIEKQKLKLKRSEKISINNLIKSILLIAEKEIKLKNINIKLKLQRIPKTIGDPNLLQEAIYKIIDNAIKYSKEKGQITIKTQKEKKNIVISIEDTGIGIPKDEQTKLFTKFFRARNASKMYQNASGLGLFVAYHIIKAHKGKIKFKSKEGKGTTFFIYLPVK